MRKLLLGGVAFTVLAGQALAADLPVRQPIYKAPPPVSLYNWTGFYWGVNIGYSWGRERNDFTVNPFATSSESQRVDGVVGGFQWGYNWQIGNFVIGTESDFQFSGQRQHHRCVTTARPPRYHRHIAFVVRDGAHTPRRSRNAQRALLRDRRPRLWPGEIGLHARRWRQSASVR